MSTKDNFYFYFQDVERVSQELSIETSKDKNIDHFISFYLPCINSMSTSIPVNSSSTNILFFRFFIDQLNLIKNKFLKYFSITGDLDDKMKWLKNFDRLLEIQRNIVWPSVLEIDPKQYYPEFLKSALSRQPCERLIVSPR